jgi:nucleotide-binding universal stress UspA family protein
MKASVAPRGVRISDQQQAPGRCGMRLVVGYDGSESAKRALERASSIATDQDQVVVVAAAEPRARAAITEGAHLDPSEIQRRRKDLEEARDFLSERGIQAETIEAQGDPGAVIVEAAKGADLAIVGSRGLNPLQRIVLGSVSSKVVHRADCDVLVVR